MIKFFPHQQKALNDTEGFDNVAYYLDMGLGKTFVGAEKMVRIGNKVNLLVCQKSKVQDWVEHFRKLYPEYDVEDLTKKNDFETFIQTWTIEEGQMIGVINYELAWRRKQLLQSYLVVLY